MSSELVLNSIPTNLRLPDGVRAQHIESDLYGICERLKEYDSAMSIVMLQQGDLVRWAIMERGPDGVERQVCRVKELDARVLDDVRKMAAIPLKERMRIIEAEIAEERRQRDIIADEELYEKIGGSFYDNLYKCGFTHNAKPMSVRPLGPAAKRAGRKV